MIHQKKPWVVPCTAHGVLPDSGTAGGKTKVYMISVLWLCWAVETEPPNSPLPLCRKTIPGCRPGMVSPILLLR